MRKFIAGTFATLALLGAVAPAIGFTPISPDSYGKAVSES